MRKDKRNFTFKFVSALFGLVHPGGEFAHLGHNIVQLGRLPLALHDDGKHSHTSQHRSFTAVRDEEKRVEKDQKGYGNRMLKDWFIVSVPYRPQWRPTRANQDPRA